MKSPLCIAGVAGIALLGCSSAPPSAPVTSTPVPKDVSKDVKVGGAATRRNVKTAIDADASKIDLTPKDTTIEEIVAQKGPADGKLEGRLAPFETSTWRVKATLQSVKLMKDGDYFLVMKGDKGGETVVEVPDPNECKESPLHSQIAEARKTLEARYHPTTVLKPLNQVATITGVGFLGWGGSGAKSAKGRNGARLMPGIAFDFPKTG